MPPSGYDYAQTCHISGFLTECLNALVKENRGVRTPHEATAREIRHIDVDLAKNERPSAAKSTLLLTRAFYEKTLKNMPGTERDFDQLHSIGIAAIREVVDEVEAIHIAGD